MMKITIFLLALIMAFPVFGQRRNKGDEDMTPVAVEGVTYALPRTGVRIHVEAVRESFVPGPYAAFAEQLLGIHDVRTRASVHWIIRKVELETFAEPDPEQVYKALGNAAFLVDLAADGCLAGINSGSSQEGLPDIRTHSLVQKELQDEGFSFAQFNDSPMFMPGDSSNNFRPVRVSTERKAAEAAERILECRLTRFHMAAGLMDVFHPDGEAYAVSLKELNRIEKNYLSLFEGHTSSRSERFSFDFIPTSASERGEVVFRFSEDKGVLPASDLSGKPVVVRINPEKGLVTKYAALASSENPHAGESGIYYRMPGIVSLSVVNELKTLATARLVMSQFGEVAPLPEELLLGNYSIEIHPETGVVKSIQRK